ncbi:hypothetical protein LTR70_006425 [Exophiala xenobiotica]|uniref:Nuclear protein 1 n=1 Tax=Lithohypha guttulata TaxID=1690604 RepID=A0ABR0K339_9EURO|nr:hypothetical protein LTR24_007374 [Lithohypha guttulata]KAK5316257.1 hypothetical protein LTR70_006425 [Exophiala xenobiotica]
MLRRLPTALTISPEDITSYDEALSRHLAYAHYKRTGEDPERLFTEGAEAGQRHTGTSGREENKTVVVDPNDELKPLPGDKARILGRSAGGREERGRG